MSSLIHVNINENQVRKYLKESNWEALECAFNLTFKLCLDEGTGSPIP